jgi:hypothetical protein
MSTILCRNTYICTKEAVPSEKGNAAKREDCRAEEIERGEHESGRKPLPRKRRPFKRGKESRVLEA